MLKAYELLTNILIDIETGLRDGLDLNLLAKKYSLTERHIQRLFKFAFEQSPAAYIRSRKLAASLEDLLTTNSNVLNIALEFGFGYEQTYIRAFKQEFGLTPGDFRKSGNIVKIKPPLHLLDKNKMSQKVHY